MDANLVTTIKMEHEALKEQVTLIKSKGIVTPAAFTELQRLKELLQAHIEQEDRLIYPLLDQLAEHDGNLQALLTRFRAEMGEITAAAEVFFGSYTECTHTLEYAKDVGSLFSRLVNRIITEEEVLYPYLCGYNVKGDQ